METFILLMLISFGAQTLKSREQRKRIVLLGTHLGKHQLEKLMENLTEGYLRALGEKDLERQAQIWHLLSTSEVELCDQFNRFVADVSREAQADTLVSKLPLALPFANTLFPNYTFDLRKMLSIHAKGINNAVNNSQNLSLKNKAFTLSAELFLMQHTCHWFCRSKAVASARTMARHKTSYAQVLASVAPDTRKAYNGLIGD